MKTAGLGTLIPETFYLGGNFISPAFSPLIIPNAYVWFSSKDMTGVDGSSVISWTDRTTNHRDAVPYGHSAPILKTNIFNGYPALDFRFGDGLTFSGNPIPTNWTLFTIFNRTGADNPILPDYSNPVSDTFDSLVTTFDSSYFTFDAGILSSFPSGFNNFLGYMGEVIIYDRILNTHETNLIHTYLNNKWSL